MISPVNIILFILNLIRFLIIAHLKKVSPLDHYPMEYCKTCVPLIPTVWWIIMEGTRLPEVQLLNLIDGPHQRDTALSSHQPAPATPSA